MELKPQAIPIEIDAKGSGLTRSLMHELSLCMKSEKWKLVMNLSTLESYVGKESASAKPYRATQQCLRTGESEGERPCSNTAFCLIDTYPGFPADRVWLVDEDEHIVARITNLAVE